jgi:hypothetical protein
MHVDAISVAAIHSFMFIEAKIGDNDPNMNSRTTNKAAEPVSKTHKIHTRNSGKNLSHLMQQKPNPHPTSTATTNLAISSIS